MAEGLSQTESNPVGARMAAFIAGAPDPVW
jgi:hypothetical protein